ncbi:cyclic-di-AMP-binding protein CbpB [Shouchella shacheensis]|uniref:cyclic-di-AMP-binding protein CbpB n=1 Tax=Shouchella shacheensis TaxID=1649580 RepID=UPI0007401B94|nr:cyclic-di-AMP-binding protein CbpB [Shouchella shacheensis]
MKILKKEVIPLFDTLKNRSISDDDIANLIIPSDKVAHVQLNNPLEHALLVLIKSGYTAIPVLDSSFKLAGTISKSLILDSLLGVENFELDRLSEKKVAEAMDVNAPCISPDATFSKALSLSINHPFLCVVDHEQAFNGILTRRSILALISKHLHQH